jgi:hypothetical protein
MALILQSSLPEVRNTLQVCYNIQIHVELVLAEESLK